MTVRPHDALFRSAFEDPRHAAGEIRCVMPVALAAAVDWATLRHEPGSFVDGELADRHTDLLFSAQVGGGRALIYLLLEHQSTNDPMMPLRMLVYIARIWERCARDGPGAGLPPIVPVVVTHAAGGWTAPTQMHALVRPSVSELPDLASLVPGFEILVDDLAGASNEALRSRALAQFPAIALWLLRDARDADTLIENLDEWAEAFHLVATAPTGAHAVMRLLRYLDLVLPEEQFERFRGKLIRLAPSTEEAAMTYGEKMQALGREEGREAGERTVLVKLLALKFGALDDASLARISAARSSELERWVERVLTATRVEAVFEP